MTLHLILVHGINNPNEYWYWPWLQDIPYQNEMYRHPIKWDSKDWNTDLLKFGMSKTFREEQINKVSDMLLKTNGEPVVLISHSFGTILAYKAWRRIGSALKGPIWSIMVGAALGGTHLPFAGPYVDFVKEEFVEFKTPFSIERSFNLYNPDDYVSSHIFMDRMENMKIDVGGFHPGFNEHDAKYYFQTMEFKWIMDQFWEKYHEQAK